MVRGHIFTFMVAWLALFPSSGQADTGSTLVVRVVGTSPSWGQESVPAWQTAAPIKTDDEYRLLDLEIGRNAENRPVYIALYAFTDQDGTNSTTGLSESEWIAYRDAHQLLRMELPSVPVETGLTGASSEDTLDGLITAFDRALDEVVADRLIIAYAGHGGPHVFFEHAITLDDSVRLLGHLRERIGFIPMVLDFSTNCDVGFLYFVHRYANIADILVASEHAVGGFGLDDGVDFSNDVLPTFHGENQHLFWRSNRPLGSALEDIVETRSERWQYSRQSMIDSRVVQSLATYDLHQFASFATQAQTSGLFDDSALLDQNDDLGIHIFEHGEEALISAYEAFRTRYVSNADFFTWDTPSTGFRSWEPENVPNLLQQLAEPQPRGVAAAVLPTSRAGVTGESVTAFATMVNVSSAPVDNCRPVPTNQSQAPIGFSFHTTDPTTNAVTGSARTGATISPGQSQSFVMEFPLTASVDPIELLVDFVCDGIRPANRISGVNTLIVSASDTPVPDIIALAVTGSQNGVAEAPEAGRTAAFAIGTFNVGSTDVITALPVPSRSDLPVELTICPTGPAGTCTSARAASTEVTIPSDASQSFAVFARTMDEIGFLPAVNRINVEFRDSGGVLRGSTSVAIRTP